jgi:hypothetical protein
VLPKNSPKFDKKTRVITLPEVEGVQWRVSGKNVEPGKQPALEPGSTVTVRAVLERGKWAHGDTEWQFGASEEGAEE